MSGSNALLRVRLTNMHFEALGIASYEFRRVSASEPLPSFTAGAHIDVHLPGNLVRSYSLINDPRERDRYVIAIQHEATGRGGSTYFHTVPRVGMEFDINSPVNDFPLYEDADDSVFICGGIGITPVLSMIARLETLAKRWHLYYAARSPENAPFLGQLSEWADSGQVRMFIGSGSKDRMSIKEAIGAGPTNAHFYCCGPRAMLDDFIDQCSGLPQDRVHFERFGAALAPALSGGFELVLAKSGKTVRVAPGQTMLDVLLEQNVPIQYSCSAGVCGTCKTAVLEGIPDHRDDYLTEREKQINNVIMVCCSGAKTDRLVLDI